MPGMTIKKYPDDILRKVCKRLDKASVDCNELDILLNGMLMVMYANRGVGLAASQVGIDKQIVVLDIGNGPIKLVNPVITKREGGAFMEEGCLSLPETSVSVKRAQKVTVNAMNEKMHPITMAADGLMARVIQHEMDHLSGVLIIDYLNPVKKYFAVKNLRQHKKSKDKVII